MAVFCSDVTSHKYSTYLSQLEYIAYRCSEDLHYDRPRNLPSNPPELLCISIVRVYTDSYADSQKLLFFYLLVKMITKVSANYSALMQASLWSLDPPSSRYHLSSPHSVIYNVRISPPLHLLYKKQRQSITISANLLVQASPFDLFPKVTLHFCQFWQIWSFTTVSPYWKLHSSSFTTVSSYLPLHSLSFTTVSPHAVRV